MQDKLLHKLDSINVALVIGAGNFVATDGLAISTYPAKFGQKGNNIGAALAQNDPGYAPSYLPNLIVVGAATMKGQRADFSQTADYLTTYRPGDDIKLPADPASKGDNYEEDGGTSFAAPQVAALVCYLRGLTSPWQDQLVSPANVKKMVTLLHRRYQLKGKGIDPKDQRPVIWNRQVHSLDEKTVIDKSCVADYNLAAVAAGKKWWGSKVCPTIDKDLANAGSGESTSQCSGGRRSKQDMGDFYAVVGNSSLNSFYDRRDDGGSCNTNPGEMSGDGGGRQTITYNPGSTASPTCPGRAGKKCGGTLCSGYYCAPTHSGTPPPDYQDPKDPNNSSPLPTTRITSGETTSSSSTTSKPATTTTTPPQTTSLPLGAVCSYSQQCLGNKCPTGQEPKCLQDMGKGETHPTCQCSISSRRTARCAAVSRTARASTSVVRGRQWRARRRATRMGSMFAFVCEEKTPPSRRGKIGVVGKCRFCFALWLSLTFVLSLLVLRLLLSMRVA